MPLLLPNPYIAGKALDSERSFFGRSDILREVERTLRRADDNAIVLYGQRRIGKTSILLQLQHRLPKPPFVPIYFDLMYRAGLPVNQVLYELAVKAAAEVSLPRPAKADFEDNQEAFHHLFLPTLYQALGDERRPVFLLDEFDVLDVAEQDLPETSAARAFRPYLYHLLTTERRLAFIFVVGRRMEELSAGFLTNFKAASRLPVSVLRPDDARTLVLHAERDETLRYEEAAVERVLALTRGHPYLTQLTCQLLFDRAFDQSSDKPPLVTAAYVEEIASEVLEKGGHAFQWIWEGLPPAERIIFSAIATESKEETIFSEGDIMAVLQDAGIRILVRELNLAPQMLVNWQMLEQVNGGYRFFVELMRRWVAANWPLDKVKEELDRINPLADSLYQTAQNYRRQGNNERAAAQLQEALDANPNHLKARLLLGAILREEGQFTEAIEQFEKAHQLDEREGRFELLRTLLQQGESLEKVGDDEQALVVYDRILSISPNEQTAQARRAALWERRGDQTLAVGDFAKAIEAYRQAGAEKKLAQVEAQQHRIELERVAADGQAHESREEWARAVDVYRRLAQLDPDEERWQQALKRVEDELWLAKQYAEGAGYVQQGEWEKAQKTLAGVIGKRPGYQDAAELLAQAKQRGQGRPDQTRQLHRQLSWIVVGGVVLLLLAVAGVWGYSQTQSQAEVVHLAATATAAEETAVIRQTTTAVAQVTNVTGAEATTAAHLTATAVVQATAAEEAALTRVAVAIQGVQLAELRATQTAEVQATQTIQAQRTTEALAIAQASQTAEFEHTTTAVAIATQTAKAPTVTPTSIRTLTGAPTKTLPPTPPVEASPSSGSFLYTAPTNLVHSRVEVTKFSFNWVWDGSLEKDEFFELRIWKDDGPHWGAVEPTKARETMVDLCILTRYTAGVRAPLREDLVGATAFCASVAVILKDPYTSLSPESNVVCWNWWEQEHPGRDEPPNCR